MRTIIFLLSAFALISCNNTKIDSKHIKEIDSLIAVVNLLKIDLQNIEIDSAKIVYHDIDKNLKNLKSTLSDLPEDSLTRTYLNLYANASKGIRRVLRNSNGHSTELEYCYEQLTKLKIDANKNIVAEKDLLQYIQDEKDAVIAIESMIIDAIEKFYKHVDEINRSEPYIKKLMDN